MAKVVSDNKFENELKGYKTRMDQLGRDVQIFISTFPTLNIKDRAQGLQKIQSELNAIGRFVTGNHSANLTSASTKFALENMRASYGSLLGRWRKFESSLALVS